MYSSNEELYLFIYVYLFVIYLVLLFLLVEIVVIGIITLDHSDRHLLISYYDYKYQKLLFKNFEHSANIIFSSEFVIKKV